jgi:hypothetical protein
MTEDAAIAGAQTIVRPVRVLRATKGDDGYRLTIEGQEELIGEVRGQDFWNRKSSRATTAKAGERTWDLVEKPVGLVAAEDGSQVARLGWIDGRQKGWKRSFVRLNPIGYLDRAGHPQMKLFVSPWQNLTKQQKKSAYVYGHWSLELPGGIAVMNFGFSNKVAARIYVGVFPAGAQETDQLLLALLCINEIWRWDEHGGSGHGVSDAGYW